MHELRPATFGFLRDQRDRFQHDCVAPRLVATHCHGETESEQQGNEADQRRLDNSERLFHPGLAARQPAPDGDAEDGRAEDDRGDHQNKRESGESSEHDYLHSEV